MRSVAGGCRNAGAADDILANLPEFSATSKGVRACAAVVPASTGVVEEHQRRLDAPADVLRAGEPELAEGRVDVRRATRASTTFASNVDPARRHVGDRLGYSAPVADALLKL